MEWLGGIFLVVIGCIMLIKPRSIWKIADSWKTKTKAEPTSIYLNLVRTGGCILLIGGIYVAMQH